MIRKNTARLPDVLVDSILIQDIMVVVLMDNLYLSLVELFVKSCRVLLNLFKPPLKIHTHLYNNRYTRYDDIG